MKIFIGIVILGFGAGGYGGLKTYLDSRADISALEERGVETDASVRSVTEVSGRRIETYHRITVAFDPEGPDETSSSEILDCPGYRYESGTGEVRIVYLPDDPQTLRLDACRGSFDANILPGLVGVVFAGLALFIAWRTRKMWTA